MKFAFKFSNLLGSVYRKGNILFSPDGNTVISPVGNRITFFDLKSNKSETLPIESRYNFTTLALSPNGCTLLAVNEVGEALLCSLISRTVLHRYHFKRPIQDIKFSPDGRYFAATKENNVFLYRAPGSHTREYAPFAMERVFHFCDDDATCIDWTSDSRVIAVGSKDMRTKIYALEKFENLSIYSLGSHNDNVVACFFEKDSLDMYTISASGQLCVWECNIDLDGLVPMAKEKEIIDVDQEEGKNNQNEDGMNQTEKIGENSKSSNKVSYKRLARHFLLDIIKSKGHVTLTAAAYHKKTHILCTGFSNSSFLLHEMPDYNLIHSLSIGEQQISSITFNNSGDWIALGSSNMGQLIVWEWQSESFVMKQQGHFNSMNCVSYSPDGQYLISGGDDGKVKVWNTSTGFCFVTFVEHTGGITGVAFIQSGKAIVSSSLDGTVRAFDLHRYRNFRTFTSPRFAQFSCLTVDPSGEIICAGSQDTFEIFVWSMKTGHLLDVLSGHEAPVSQVRFSPTQAVLISVSWDKTVRIWDIFETKKSRETISLPADGLTIEFRPDGKEFAVATLDGQISFFHVQTGSQIASIEGRNDLGSGRKDTDLVTAKKLLQGQAFTTLCYTADGECILAAGKSKNVCIYNVAEQMIMKKFIITCNHSFDAVEDFINRRKMTEFGNKSLIENFNDDSVSISLPGVKKGDMASRAFKPEVRVSCVQFSPTGRAWAASTTEGLLIYSLDHALIFDPFELEENITPSTIRSELHNKEYSKAIMMAFKLNEQDLITEIIENIPLENVELLSRCLPQVYVEKMLGFLAAQLEKSRHIEFYLIWIQHLLTSHGPKLKERSPSIMSILRNLQKNITQQYESLGKICDHNKYSLEYILAVGKTIKRRAAENEEKLETDFQFEAFT